MLVSEEGSVMGGELLGGAAGEKEWRAVLYSY